MVKKILIKVAQYPFDREIRLKVFLAILEKTYLSNKREVVLSVRDLSEYLGFSKSCCFDAVSWLETRKIIKKKLGRRDQSSRFQVNTRLKDWLVIAPKRNNNPVFFKQIRKKYAKLTIENQIKKLNDILRDLRIYDQGLDVPSLRTSLKGLADIKRYEFDIIKDIKMLEPFVQNYTSWSSALIPILIIELKVFINKNRLQKRLRQKAKTFLTHQLKAPRDEV